jgi:hypothetical protein
MRYCCAAAAVAVGAEVAAVVQEVALLIVLE